MIVYLLYGPHYTGKSSLAKKLAAYYGEDKAKVCDISYHNLLDEHTTYNDLGILISLLSSASIGKVGTILSELANQSIYLSRYASYVEREIKESKGYKVVIFPRSFDGITYLIAKIRYARNRYNLFPENVVDEIGIFTSLFRYMSRKIEEGIAEYDDIRLIVKTKRNKPITQDDEYEIAKRLSGGNLFTKYYDYKELDSIILNTYEEYNLAKIGVDIGYKVIEVNDILSESPDCIVSRFEDGQKV